MTTKPCKTCSAVKPLKLFYRNRGTADGRESSCKECRKQYACDMYVLKRERVVEVRKLYARSPEGRATRARYLANGGRELFNEARRMNRRIRQMSA